MSAQVIGRSSAGRPGRLWRPGSLASRLVAGLVALVCCTPLVVIVTKALAVGPEKAGQLLWRPRVGELLGNTLSLVVLTVSITVVLGVAAAWLVERTDLPLAGLWRVVLVCPLAVPAFVNAYAWVSIRPDLNGLTGAVLVTSLSYFPFVFLPVAAVLRGLDRSLEDTARSLGLGPWRAFLRATLPQLRPALMGGALLVALHLLAEFGVLALVRFPTFTTAILDQYQVAFDDAAGSVLASALLALCLAFLTIDLVSRGRARHARLGRGTPQRPTPVRLGRLTPVALAGIGLLVLLAIAVPVGSIGRWLAMGADSLSAGDLLGPVWSSLRLAATAAVLTTVAAFPVAWLVSRATDRFDRWVAVAVERSTYLASSLPGVVVALALVGLAVRYLPSVYQTSALLVLAYAILFVPRAMVSIRAALAHLPPELGDAARALGDNPVRAFLRVQLPLVLRGTLAGFALVFIAVSTELTATLLLAPTGTRTLATAFWAASESLDYAAAAPYAAALVILSAPVTYLLMRRTEEVTAT
ncbi:MAG: ABC transporter permease [Terrabacter sp.]